MIKSTLATLIAAAALSSAALVYADAPATQPVKPYPFTKCMISGEALGGDMGEPVVIDYKGQEVKFCCSSCLAKFKKDPDKYMKQIEDAEKTPAK